MSALVGLIACGDPPEVQRVDLREYGTVGFPTSEFSGGVNVPDVIRDQSPHASCIAFAAIAALEAAHKRAGYGDLDLSEEFANYMNKALWIKENWDTPGMEPPASESLGANYAESQLGYTTRGKGVESLLSFTEGHRAVADSFMPYVTDTLGTYISSTGACYPYNSERCLTQRGANDFNLNPLNFTRGGGDARQAGLYYSARRVRVLCGRAGAPPCSTLEPVDFEAVLRLGHEIVIDFDVGGDRSGPIWIADDTAPNDSHAMLLVGFQSSAAGSYFIAKNSWGRTSGGVDGDCGEDGHTCISYDYLRYLEAAAYIETLNPPEAWTDVAFVGRWDMSIDGERYLLDLSHLPGIMNGWFRRATAFNFYEDRRLGLLRDSAGVTYRVNGIVTGNRLDLYFDSMTPNLRWDKLQGSHLMLHRFAGDFDTMAGIAEGEPFRAAYARKSFSRSGFLRPHVPPQTFVPENFLGYWNLNVDGVQYTLRFRFVSPWVGFPPGIGDNVSVIGTMSPTGSDVITPVVATVPRSNPGRIRFQATLVDGSRRVLAGKRFGTEQEIFAGRGDADVGFYAIRGAPGVALTITAPAEGASFHRGTERLELAAEVSGVDPEAVVWDSNRSGRIGTGPRVALTILPSGEHTVTASVRSGDGSASDSVTIHVLNDPPSLTVLSPTPAAVFEQGQIIALSANTFDPNDGAPVADSRVTWWIGERLVGTGHSTSLLASTLVLGEQLLRVNAHDGEVTSEVTLPFAVVAGTPGSNAPPVAIITSPVSGAILLADQRAKTGGWQAVVDLCGRGEDPEDGVLSGARLQWSARVSDASTPPLVSGGGKPCTRAALPAVYPDRNTPYDIDLVVTDSGGRTGQARVHIEISALF